MPGLLLLQGALDLETYSNVGADATAYFLIAVAATLLFVIKLGLQLFVGDVEADLDTDLDADLDSDIDSTGNFQLLSLLSVLAFLMGAGWMGLACRVSWSLAAGVSAFAAFGFGLALMVLASGLMYGVKQMTQVKTVNPNTAIGSIAKVYLTIPQKGKGRGQIEVAVSGRRRVLPAVSEGDEIPVFTSVRVLDVRSDRSFVVAPKSDQTKKPPRARR